jgi:hypothetical protein
VAEKKLDVLQVHSLVSVEILPMLQGWKRQGKGATSA